MGSYNETTYCLNACKNEHGFHRFSKWNLPKESGPSEMTQPSSVVSRVSLHRGKKTNLHVQFINSWLNTLHRNLRTPKIQGLIKLVHPHGRQATKRQQKQTIDKTWPECDTCTKTCLKHRSVNRRLIHVSSIPADWTSLVIDIPKVDRSCDWHSEGVLTGWG